MKFLVRDPVPAYRQTADADDDAAVAVGAGYDAYALRIVAEVIDNLDAVRPERADKPVDHGLQGGSFTGQEVAHVMGDASAA